MSSFIILSAKGAAKQAQLIDISDGVENALGKIFKRAKPPVLIGNWTWQKYKLYLYGYKEGRSGSENKNDIPSPYDEETLYGDACVIASLEKNVLKPADFTLDLYKRFYNSKEDADNDGGEDEEDDEEDDEELEEEYEEEQEYEEEDDAIIEEEEEEEKRPALLVKPSTGFKKIAKWMHQPELDTEKYVL